MRFFPAGLDGAFRIEPEPFTDARGFFARTWCRDEFSAHGLPADPVQCSISYNRLRGTLRGMHLQRPPHAEPKLVRCTAGAIFDVIVDLRRDSPTFTRWIAFELTARNRHALYVPAGFAHGFQTLEDDTEVSYQMFAFHAPDSATGWRWDDPAFGIKWPLEVAMISDSDRRYPDFDGTAG